MDVFFVGECRHSCQQTTSLNRCLQQNIERNFRNKPLCRDWYWENNGKHQESWLENIVGGGK